MSHSSDFLQCRRGKYFQAQAISQLKTQAGALILGKYVLTKIHKHNNSNAKLE